MINDSTWDAEKNIEYVVDQVMKRGWIDIPIEIDCFGDLRRDRRVRDGSVVALYEQYFLPKRHEFEWQALSDIVNALVTAPTVQFAGMAIAGGVLGNAAYDLLKTLCHHTASLFEQKLGTGAQERARGFRQIADDTEKLKKFFSEHHRARIADIEQATGLPREKIYPLIKLAGLNHYRRSDPCWWEMPEDLNDAIREI